MSAALPPTVDLQEELGEDMGKRWNHSRPARKRQHACPAKAPRDPALTFQRLKGTWLLHHICLPHLSKNVSQPILTGNIQEGKSGDYFSLAKLLRYKATMLLLGGDFQNLLMCEKCKFWGITDICFKKNSSTQIISICTQLGMCMQRDGLGKNTDRGRLWKEIVTGEGDVKGTEFI